MEFKTFCRFMERLEGTSSRLEKTKILSDLYSKSDELKETISLSYGWLPEITGIGENLMRKAISLSYGIPEDEVERAFIKKGDMGLVAEELSSSRKQSTLLGKEFSVGDVYRAILSLKEVQGKGAVDRKLSILSDMLAHMSGLEAKYLCRIVLGTMRLGVGDGLVRDAIAKAFSKTPEEIERAFNLVGDYGEVGKLAKENRLSEARMEIGRPVRVMLAEASTLEEAVKLPEPTAEIKYDGFRCQIHKKGSRVWIFSRRMEDLTDRFPEIVEEALSLDGDFIIDGEAVGFKNGKMLPFQFVSRRIQRKYSIEEMRKQIPVKVFVFDVLYREGDVTGLPLSERRKILESFVRNGEIIELAGHVESGFGEFYKKAVDSGLEGIMVKSLESKYIPGKRVGTWCKVKPEKETLDVVVVGAEYGEGRKASLLSSFYVAVRSGDGLVEIGKVSSGFSDRELLEMNKRLLGLSKGEGKFVRVEPSVVIEVRYQEIQRSPAYSSGFALRFPRFVRFRDDKSVSEIDTIERVNQLFLKQS